MPLCLLVDKDKCSCAPMYAFDGMYFDCNVELVREIVCSFSYAGLVEASQEFKNLAAA